MLNPIKDRLLLLKNNLQALNWTLEHVTEKSAEDWRIQKQKMLDKKVILTKNNEIDANRNIRTIDNAFLQIMKYKLYQKAVDFKQKEFQQNSKNKSKDNEKEKQKKIDEKQNNIIQIKGEIAELTEKLNKNRNEAEEISKACSGKLENLPAYKEDIE